MLVVGGGVGDVEHHSLRCHLSSGDRDGYLRAEANGHSFQWLTFDEYYGGKPAFVEALDTRQKTYYVAEIPRNFRCRATQPRGRRPKKGWKGKRADSLLQFSSALNRHGWASVSLQRLTLGDQQWEVRSGQVYLVREGNLTSRTYWLLWARNVGDWRGEVFPLQRTL